MADPIRVLHFADLHIGMENYGRLDPVSGLNRRVIDFLDRLDSVVAYAREHDADLVLFAGDAFRNRNPSPTYQREFAQRIRELSLAGIETVLLVGNHDVPVMTQRASSIEIFGTLAVPHITVIDRPRVLELATRRGPVQVVAVPYPVRQRMLTQDQFRQLSQEELDMAVSDAVVQLIDGMAAQLRPELPAILLGHFSIAEARWGSERSIMVGRDVTLPVSALVDPCWSYVALGHVHQHQNLNPNGAPPVVYSGSLERVDFGEERQSKGFCWIELGMNGAGEHETAWRYVELPARRFLTLRVDLREEPDPAAALEAAIRRHDLAGVVVRVVIQMTPEQEPGLRDGDIVPLLEDAFYAQVNREIERTVRDRLEGVDHDDMVPLKLLERYLLARGRGPQELAPYLDAAARICGSTGALSEEG
jgi:DNA repair protein SbcD/Mre11